MVEAIILAGGLGTRLHDAVPDRPKPMADVNGRPFITYLMDHWAAQGVTRFVLSVGYMKEAVVAYFGNRYGDIPVSYAVETEPLGTGGGVLNAMARLRGKGPFLVINGDTFIPVAWQGLWANHRERDADVSIALHRVGVNDRYSGVSVDDQGLLTAFATERGSSSGSYINAGAYLIDPSALTDYSTRPPGRISLEDEIFPALVSRGMRVAGYPQPGPFIDIGVPDDYYRCSELFSRI